MSDAEKADRLRVALHTLLYRIPEWNKRDKHISIHDGVESAHTDFGDAWLLAEQTVRDDQAVT